MKKHNKSKTKTKTRRNKLTRRKTPAFSPYSPAQRYISYPDAETAVFGFKQLTDGMTYELCATLKPAANEWRLTIHNNGQPTNIGERGSCTYEHYEHIILHNHPDKYYPSREDIEKVVKAKNRVILESYIACKFGLWRIEMDPIYKLSENEVSAKSLAANSVLDDFYRATGRGRKYDEDEVGILCRKIADIYDGVKLQFIYL